MNVEQLMTRDVATCSPDDTLREAARIMWERDCGAVPVVDGTGRVTGMLTDRDVCMAALIDGRPLDQLAVTASMSTPVASCAPGDSIDSVHRLLRRRRVRRLPVVDDDGRLVGILSLSDVALATERRRLREPGDSSASDLVTTLATICEARLARVEGGAQVTG